MIEIREISDDRDIDLGQIRTGGSEYRFLSHLWYYGYLPTYEYYKRKYDHSRLSHTISCNYTKYLTKTWNGSYGFTDYDEELIYKAKESVRKHEQR